MARGRPRSCRLILTAKHPFEPGRGVSSGESTYTIAVPSMNSPAVVGLDQATLLPGFNPTDNEIAGVPDVMDFAQNAYQLLSLMSQVPDSGNGPISTQVLGNVIGGNIAFASLNPDVFHHTGSRLPHDDQIAPARRDDFNVQNDPTTWYPRPDLGTGSETYNVYNLDPFVWFVHQQMGLSGYGFSLDDDTADVSGNFSTKLGIAIGGLNGLPNQFQWTNPRRFGPVSNGHRQSAQEIAGLSPYVFFSVMPYNNRENASEPTFRAWEFPPAPAWRPLAPAACIHTPTLSPTSPPTPSNQLQIPPLVLNGTSEFTLMGNGTVQHWPGHSHTARRSNQALRTLFESPCMDWRFLAAARSTIVALIGTQTSYTQQFEELARVSTYRLPHWIRREPAPRRSWTTRRLPDLNTVVNGILHAGHVNIVDGWLTGTGTVEGDLNLFGPVGGYADPIEHDASR